MATKTKRRPVVVSDEVKAARAQGLSPVTTIKDAGDKVIIVMANGAQLERVLAQKAKESAVPSATADNSGSLSPARLLLRRLGVGSKPRTEALDFAGETFYVRRLDSVGMNRVGAMSARNREGTLDFILDDDLRSFMRAVLFVCTAQDEAGRLDYFDQMESWDLVAATESEARSLVDMLFAKALDVNPDLLPQQAAAKEVDEKKDNE